MVGQSLIVLFISFELFFLITLQSARDGFFVTVFIKHAVDHKHIRAGFYLLTVNRVKVTFAKRQVMYRIQQIGFARAVITCKSIYTLAEIEFSLAVILKVDNG